MPEIIPCILFTNLSVRFLINITGAPFFSHNTLGTLILCRFSPGSTELNSYICHGCSIMLLLLKSSTCSFVENNTVVFSVSGGNILFKLLMNAIDSGLTLPIAHSSMALIRGISLCRIIVLRTILCGNTLSKILEVKQNYPSSP